jgi:hypothetical protein
MLNVLMESRCVVLIEQTLEVDLVGRVRCCALTENGVDEIEIVLIPKNGRWVGGE